VFTASQDYIEAMQWKLAYESKRSSRDGENYLIISFLVVVNSSHKIVTVVILITITCSKHGKNKTYIQILSWKTSKEEPTCETSAV